VHVALKAGALRMFGNRGGDVERERQSGSPIFA
jgi:hypothetical protein